MTAASPQKGSRRRGLLARVHIAQKELALTDESYRAVLRRITRRDSAAKCGDGQLVALLDEFKRLGWSGKKSKPKRAGDSRPLATSKTAGKMRALWLSLYHLGEVEDPSEEALAAFVTRQTGADALQWVSPEQAFKVIEALKEWCGRAGFQQPDNDLLKRMNGWRALAGLAPINLGFAAKTLLIRLLWDDLWRAGAFRLDGAKQETWLTNHWSVAAPHFLEPHQADQAIEQLGAWLRRTRAGKDHEIMKS